MGANRAETLRNARTSYAVAWHSFQRIYEHHPKALYCFFEGIDDPKYYDVRISIIMYGISIKHITCNGKSGVLKLRELIYASSNHDKAWTAFFVDADFDDNSQLSSHADVYVTPCYSIENLFVSQTAFIRLLGAEFSLSDEDSCQPDYQSALRIYTTCMESFSNATDHLNGWIYLQRKSNSKMNLNDMSLSLIVRYSLAGSVASYSTQSLEHIFPETKSLTQAEIDSWIASVPKAKRTETYRGKYLLQCYCQFLKELIQDRNSRQPQYFSSRAKVSLTLHDGNLISQLSQYADTPPCLVEFLKKTMKSAPL